MEMFLFGLLAGLGIGVSGTLVWGVWFLARADSDVADERYLR